MSHTHVSGHVLDPLGSLGDFIAHMDHEALGFTVSAGRVVPFARGRDLDAYAAECFRRHERHLLHLADVLAGGEVLV
jgi:hypothetical protein